MDHENGDLRGQEMKEVTDQQWILIHVKGQVVKEDFLHCFFKIISFFVSVCGGLGTQETPVVFICTRWDKLNIGQAKLRQIELLTLVEPFEQFYKRLSYCYSLHDNI